MMDTATAARAVQGRLIGTNLPFSRVTTDTRTLAAGDLFVALKGDQFDGHDFVPVAFERGASAVLVADERADALAGERIAVPDPLAALGQLASYWRRRFAIPVIAVVGSNGKTTVKEMIAAILRAQFGDEHVHATRGNLNNAIGLPLTVLGLRERHRAAVIELGMNHPGETAELAAIVRPTIALINNAQREHQEFMLNTAMVAAEHASLLRALGEGGIAVLNADDAHVELWRGVAGDEHRAVVDFALDHQAEVTGRYATGEDGAGVLDLATNAGGARVRMPIAGRHNALNALAAAAAGRAVGIAPEVIRRGLESFRPVAGRLVTRQTPQGAVVIDDTYNANPDSVRAAIDVLAGMRGPKWLVLGDMGEVGEQGASYHHEVGEYAREKGIVRLFAAGAMTAATAAAFGAGASHYTSVEDLMRELPVGEAAGVTVLVKGSRFMRMERVVAMLTGEAPAGGAH